MLICLQVETVGDKYMAVSGLPEPCRSHARCVARLALDLIDLSKRICAQDGRNAGIVSHRSIEITGTHIHTNKLPKNVIVYSAAINNRNS